MANYVTYLRVSTDKQGIQGLGIEAQRHAVALYLNGTAPLAEYAEAESGKRNDRVQLSNAIEHCRLTGSTLVIARLDRLARNVDVLRVLEEAKVEFVACDMPSANKLTIGIMLLVAEAERERISKNTKAALAAAKGRGTRLGNPSLPTGNATTAALASAAASANADDFARSLAPRLSALRSSGATTLRAIADGLNDQRIKTPRNGLWHAASVRALIARLEELARPSV